MNAIPPHFGLLVFVASSVKLILGNLGSRKKTISQEQEEPPP
jgi:hypothetical protein